ncbi:uncharacterized protein METZ01_LOCUS260928, partial [marine metagenome]
FLNTDSRCTWELSNQQSNLKFIGETVRSVC